MNSSDVESLISKGLMILIIAMVIISLPETFETIFNLGRDFGSSIGEAVLSFF